MKTQATTLTRLLGRREILRASAARAAGVSSTTLSRLVQRGWLHRVGRGLYMRADSAAVTEHHTLAEAATRLPKGTVCLLSALQFHGLGTQTPHEVWIAIDHKAAQPRIDAPTVRVVRFSGRALTSGVETHRIEGVPVRIYSSAKTVADAFKFRNRIGLDVAVEALKAYLRRRDRDLDALARFARICRVERVMDPYLSALL